MRGVSGSILSAIAAGLVLGGCTAAAPRTESSGRSHSNGPAYSPGLVLHPLRPFVEADRIAGPASGDRTPASGRWEDHRNDEGLGITAAAPPAHFQWLEVRSIDHRWNTNGRVRESSRTTTRTLRRGLWPAE